MERGFALKRDHLPHLIPPAPAQQRHPEAESTNGGGGWDGGTRYSDAATLRHCDKGDNGNETLQSEYVHAHAYSDSSGGSHPAAPGARLGWTRLRNSHRLAAARMVRLTGRGHAKHVSSAFRCPSVPAPVVMSR